MSCIPASQGVDQRLQTPRISEGSRARLRSEEPGREVMKESDRERERERERERKTHTEGTRAGDVETDRGMCRVINQGYTHTDGETQREAEAAIRGETE